MTRTTPYLALPSLDLLTIPAGGRFIHDIRFNAHEAHIPGGSSMDSGFEPRDYRPRSLTTRSPLEATPTVVRKTSTFSHIYTVQCILC
ncbi:hypothetical protein AVEN_271284-1 [Araneus ventricosus]|uniref:Uncharacterized protein n=1 Tax=Araneus ventricosus TaxID=182803 RepID=A0A4Y2JMM5_ARAVE|nr:hypothetical protein AVEN_271284-1 [Araneus ventricosus]